MSSLSIACAGFLAGVLWMDLLFDSQIVRMPPEQAVAVISAYYKNATIDAQPLSRIIALTMLVWAGGAFFELLYGRIDRRLALAGAATAALPVGLALARVVPNAMLLGSQSSSTEQQIALARAIFFDHIICLTFVLAFIVIRTVAATADRHGSAVYNT
jgi:uncharacterized protein YgbK (DUF1537 family)